VAVLYELANQNLPAELVPGERISTSATKALFLIRYQSVSEEKENPGW